MLAAVSIVMIVVFATSYNFQVSLALIASETLSGNGQTHGASMSVLGLGALVGSLVLTRRARVMALYSICFMGSSLVGGPAFGALAEWIGVCGALRVSAAVRGVAALAGMIVWLVRQRCGHW